MKNIITLVLIATSLSLSAQKKVLGYWEFLDAVKFDSAMRIDTGMIDTTGGFVLQLDTAGSDTLGYYSVSAGSISGFPTGSGANGRVTFWSGASTLSSNAGFLFDSTTSRLTTTGGAFPAMKVSRYSMVDTNSAFRIKRGAVEKLSVNSAGVTVNDSACFDDNIAIDTGTVDLSVGAFFGWDSTGASETGYANLVTKAAVTGAGTINQVGYFSGTSTIAGNLGFTFNAATTAVAITAGSSTTPLSVTGATGDNVQLLGLSVAEEASETQFITGGVKGMAFRVDASEERLSLNTTTTVFNEAFAATPPPVIFRGTSDTVMYVDGVNNRVGINESSPDAPLHIDAGSVIAIKLTDPSVEAPGLGTALFTNFPGGFATTPIWVQVTIEIGGLPVTGLVPVFIP